MTKDIDLDALEATARAATPGPWRVEVCSYDPERVDGIYGPERTVNYGLGPERDDPQIVETDGGYYPPKMPDAKYIAAMSPDVTLALIARIRELEEAANERDQSAWERSERD